MTFLFMKFYKNIFLSNSALGEARVCWLVWAGLRVLVWILRILRRREEPGPAWSSGAPSGEMQPSLHNEHSPAEALSSHQWTWPSPACEAPSDNPSLHPLTEARGEFGRHSSPIMSWMRCFNDSELLSGFEALYLF